MTRRPRQQPNPEEAHAAMARVFGVDVEADAAASSPTVPEPPAEESEGRVALGRVFGTEA
jgi:hypothetical protein